MDGVSAKVVTIQTELQKSSRQLQIYENEAQKSVGGEVSEMRDALESSDRRIQFLSSEMQSFLKLIEHKEPHSVDLSPQMDWLSSSLTTIAKSFQEAEQHADYALSHTMTYQYQVSNVGQEVEVQKGKLEIAQDEGDRVTQQIQSELSESERKMEDAQSRMRDKHDEIYSKSARVRSLKTQKSSYEETIKQKQVAINRANAKAEAKKEKGAGLAIGASILGIGLAPFTGGASLGLLAVGAGVGIGTAVVVDDLRNEASNARAAVSQLQNQISSEQNEISTLEREKSQLENLVEGYEADIRMYKARRVDYQAQILKAATAKSEIEMLKKCADSTCTNVQDLWKELQIAKMVLDECTAAINGQSLNLKTTSSFTDRLFGKSYRNQREFQAQQKVLRKVAESLDEMHGKVPGLLKMETKFLDIKSWNSGSTSVTELDSQIPGIQFRGY